MKTIRNILLPFLIMSLSACANFTHFNDKETFDKTSAFVVDAKQRGIFVYEKTKKYKEGDKQVEEIMKGFCAEPSPDAVSAMAATLGMDLTITDKGKLGLSNSISEGVANIGLRTAAIQALRDVMYRNCEAYGMGGVTKFGLETLQRRFQSSMVAILAIEQLTGAVRTPNTVITSQTSGGSPDAVLELTNKTEVARFAYETALIEENKASEKLDEAKKEVEESEESLNKFKEEVAAIEAKAEADRSTSEKGKLASKDEKTKELEETIAKKNTEKDVANSALESAQKTTTEKKQAYEALDASRIAALSGGGTAKTNAVVTKTIQAQPMSKEAVAEISGAVTNIVSMTTQLSYWTEVCTTLIGQGTNGTTTPPKNSTLGICNMLVASANDPEKFNKVFLTASEAFSFDPGWGDEGQEQEQESQEETQEIDPSVQDLQKKLNTLGFPDDDGKPLNMDNVWGAKTVESFNNMLAACKDKYDGAIPDISEESIKAMFLYLKKVEEAQCTPEG